MNDKILKTKRDSAATRCDSSIPPRIDEMAPFLLDEVDHIEGNALVVGNHTLVPVAGMSPMGDSRRAQTTQWTTAARK